MELTPKTSASQRREDGHGNAEEGMRYKKRL